MTTAISAGTRTSATVTMIVVDELRRGDGASSASLVVRHTCVTGSFSIGGCTTFHDRCCPHFSVEYGARVVPTAWTVKDSSGQMLQHFIAASRLEVARKVVPTRYDAFRLQVSSSNRQMFNRHLKAILEREAWQIVPIKRRRLEHGARARVLRGDPAP